MNIPKILNRAKSHFPKNSKGETTPFDTTEKASRYLDALKDEARNNIEKSDVTISTSTEDERLKYLNYCVSLIPDKYIKHKILLFFMINKYEGSFIPKSFIAKQLTKHLGKSISIKDIDKIEKEAKKIMSDTLTKLNKGGIII